MLVCFITQKLLKCYIGLFLFCGILEDNGSKMFVPIFSPSIIKQLQVTSNRKETLIKLLWHVSVKTLVKISGDEREHRNKWSHVFPKSLTSSEYKQSQFKFYFKIGFKLNNWSHRRTGFYVFCKTADN